MAPSHGKPTELEDVSSTSATELPAEYPVLHELRG
jgi:hypothetical protein